MRVSQELISNKIALVLKSGHVIFPIKMSCQDTGVVAFRVSDGENTVRASEQVDEQTMIRKVLKDGRAVRCSSIDGKIKGIYRPTGRSVRQVRVLA